MKQNVIYFGTIICVLLAIASWSVYGMLHIGKEEHTVKVSVIVNNSNSDRWTAMREGLEQSAGDNHVELTFVSTPELASVEEEVILMNREIDNGADGLIVQMIASDDTSEILNEISSKVDIVLVDTDVSPEELYSTVLTDHEALGHALVQSVLDSLGSRASSNRIAILSGNQSQLAMQQSLAGVQEELQQAGITPVWEQERSGVDWQMQLSRKLQEQNVDVLITLSSDETEAAVDVILAENLTNCKVFGVGGSEKSVYYLDKGLIHTLVVPNEFNMGYQSLEMLAKRIQYKTTGAEHMQIDYVIVDQDNLYEEDNQKIVFPIVQ